MTGMDDDTAPGAYPPPLPAISDDEYVTLLFRDKQGHPIDAITWAGLKEAGRINPVGSDEVRRPDGLYLLRTVFLGESDEICDCGIHHLFGSAYAKIGPDGHTMQFQEAATYDSESDAAAGHARLKHELANNEQLPSAH